MRLLCITDVEVLLTHRPANFINHLSSTVPYSGQPGSMSLLARSPIAEQDRQVGGADSTVAVEVGGAS